MWETIVDRLDICDYNNYTNEFESITEDVIGDKLKFYIPNYPVCKKIQLSLFVNSSDYIFQNIEIIGKFNNAIKDDELLNNSVGKIDSVGKLLEPVMFSIDNDKEHEFFILNLFDAELVEFGGYFYLDIKKNKERISKIKYHLEFNDYAIYNFCNDIGERRDSEVIPSAYIKRKNRSGELIRDLPNGVYRVKVLNKEFKIVIDDDNRHIVRNIII